MYIFECWEKIKIHFLAVTVIFIGLCCSKFLFKENLDAIFNLMYIAGSATVSLSCLILGIKRGFLWYYPICILFSSTVIMTMFFSYDFPDMIIIMFVNNFSAAFVTSAIGGIIHKIRKNNKED